MYARGGAGTTGAPAMFNAPAYLEIARAHGLPPFPEPEPAEGDMPSAADLYAELHDADVAAATADSPYFAGGVFYANPDDAALVRQRMQERAARDQERRMRYEARHGRGAAA